MPELEINSAGRDAAIGLVKVHPEDPGSVKDWIDKEEEELSQCERL